jgi:Mg-chelatase subunit ChlD
MNSKLDELDEQRPDESERLRRWRLVLGGAASEGLATGACASALTGQDKDMDDVLRELYECEKGAGSLAKSAPHVSRWLGDIRTYFPTQSVQVMQQDAIDRLGITTMLLQPEVLEQVQPDVNLVATLVSLNKAIPEETKETARQVVRQVADQLERKLANPLIQAVRGSINRAARTYRPRANEIDWQRTIRLNLKNYLPEKKTIIAERLVGYGHKRSSLRDIVLCVDQSGSMATSVVYSSIFGAVLATIRAVSTRMIVFDTAVVDLTEELHDPVDLLFGTQLGGGTDINKALGYCQQSIEKPNQTILVLITDLYEGGDAKQMLQRAAELVESGVHVVCLLALGDSGAPSYDHHNAAALAQLGIPCFACTPELFPDLMAAAIQKQDLNRWAASNDIVTARSENA